MIGAISAYGMNPINAYSMYGSYGTSGVNAEEGASVLNASGSVDGSEKDQKTETIKNPGESTTVQPGKKSSPAECQTCKERKYQDGSDEMVSFKSATHLSPTSAASAVRSHEQEHVSNAYKKAAQNDGKVVSCGVSIHTSVCPECGRTYVSGGTTTTSIKYSNESNPYVKDMKAQHADALSGANIDMAV